MKNLALKFVTLLSISCVVLIAIVLGLIFMSERFTGAGVLLPERKSNISHSAPTDVYVNALENIREQYAGVTAVELEAVVAIDIIKTDSIVSGTGRVNFAAEDNKYKYACEITENLENEGLMRNVDVLYNGDRFYFYDHESNIVSFQKSEQVRLPAALPNPFFLPIEFLSTDDDSCEGCKMRIQDVKMPLNWAKRVSSISELSSETINGTTHSLIQMPGGTLNKIPYDFRVRLVGESPESLQPISVARINEEGSPLVEVLLSDLRSVAGINVKIPYVIEVGARDETGRLVFKAVYTITRLKINQSFATNLLSPDFPDAERFWDSDAKSFVEQ